MLAATPAPTDHRYDGADKDSDFPGEQPSDKELSDWLEAVLPSVRQSFGAVLNGDVPSHLIELTLGADDLTGYNRITLGSTAASTMTALVRWPHSTAKSLKLKPQRHNAKLNLNRECVNTKTVWRSGWKLGCSGMQGSDSSDLRSPTPMVITTTALP